MSTEYQVPAGIEERLDVWLASQLKITRSQVQRLIRQKAVLVNGKLPKKTGDIVELDSVITVEDLVPSIPKKGKKNDSNQALFKEIVVIADTPDYIVIQKPAGLIVHPSTSIDDVKVVAASITVAGWVLQTYPKIAGVGEYVNRPGIVHRLDKGTSGLMVIAKNQAMFKHLKQQFKDRLVEKNYYALAHGAIAVESGMLDFPIGRGEDGRMAARPIISSVTLRNVASLTPGRPALTEFTVKQRFVNFTFLDIRLHTGRTHQIRVHFFAYNHPLVGDPVYHQKGYEREAKKFSLGRVFLHSYHLAFQLPNGERVEYNSPLPPELKKILTTLS